MHRVSDAVKLTQKQRLLAVLSDGRQHHMRELNDICFRYGGRILELRRQGHDIETIQLGAGEFAYRLRVTPKQLTFV